MHALVAEAMKKTAIIWLSVADRPAYPLWCLPMGEALYVVTGGDEQPAPALLDAARAVVTARGDHGGRIVSWPVTVGRIAPDDSAWAEVAAPLAGKRLNASGPVADLVARWAVTSRIVRLTPIGDDVDTGTSDSSGAAVPRETPATRRAT